MNTEDDKNKPRNSIKEYLKTPPEERKRNTGFVKFNRKDRTITPIKLGSSVSTPL